jgi:hypothetical protein
LALDKSSDVTPDFVASCSCGRFAKVVGAMRCGPHAWTLRPASGIAEPLTQGGVLQQGPNKFRAASFLAASAFHQHFVTAASVLTNVCERLLSACALSVIRAG